MNKKEMDKKESEKPKNNTVIHILVMILCIIMSIVCISSISSAIKTHNTYDKANFIKAEATIVEYRDYLVGSYVHYKTYYEFISQDGKRFTGLWDTRIKSEQEAKDQIGRKVTVYYDSKLGICDTRTETDSLSGAWIMGALSIFFIALFLNSFIREMFFISRWHKYQGAKEDI